MALQSTQPLMEMGTRNISLGVKGASAYGWQPYHFRVSVVLKSASPNHLDPSGTVQACNGIALPLSVGLYIRIANWMTKLCAEWQQIYPDFRLLWIVYKQNYLSRFFPNIWNVLPSQRVYYLSSCCGTYTLSNKNPSAWNFLSPKPEVRCGTVAIIIRVFFLSPYLLIRGVSLSSIHYNQSHRVYINRRQQYICLIWN